VALSPCCCGTTVQRNSEVLVDCFIVWEQESFKFPPERDDWWSRLDSRLAVESSKPELQPATGKARSLIVMWHVDVCSGSSGKVGAAVRGADKAAETASVVPAAWADVWHEGRSEAGGRFIPCRWLSHSHSNESRKSRLVSFRFLVSW